MLVPSSKMPRVISKAHCKHFLCPSSVATTGYSRKPWAPTLLECKVQAQHQFVLDCAAKERTNKQSRICYLFAARQTVADGTQNSPNFLLISQKQQGVSRNLAMASLIKETHLTPWLDTPSSEKRAFRIFLGHGVNPNHNYQFYLRFHILHLSSLHTGPIGPCFLTGVSVYGPFMDWWWHVAYGLHVHIA